MKHGFTLVEVMLAMMVLAVAVTSLSSIQFRALNRVQRNDNTVEKIFVIKQRLLSFLLDQKKIKQLENMRPHVTKDEDSDLKLTTQLVEINKKSTLVPLKERIAIIQTEATWSYDTFPRQEKMISFVVRQPKKEEAQA